MSLRTLKQAVTYGTAQLIHSDTAQLDTELLLLHVIQQPRTILYTHPHTELNLQQTAQFDELLKRRCQGEPVAYIIGQQGFWDLDLEVSPHTLIPRPDTEALVDWVLENISSPRRILDLGTGTGALALALAKEFPSAQVYGVDLIPESLALAQRNAKRNQVNNVHFMQSEWFSNVTQGPFDLIVSNPPYIDPDDPHLKQGDVRFEPSSALISDDHGMADIRIICQQASAYMCKGGVLVIEHGYDQGETVAECFVDCGWHAVATEKDLALRPRFTHGVHDV